MIAFAAPSHNEPAAQPFPPSEKFEVGFVIEELRQTVTASRSVAPVLAELENRIRQLLADMVNGRVLPKAEATALRAAIIDFARSEALPKFGSKNPNDGLRILNMFRAYGVSQLDGERASLEVARAQKSPPPTPADWPEIEQIRAAAQSYPAGCCVHPGVTTVHFAQELKADRLPLPNDLLTLYAACDGFDLSCLAADTYVLPVFSLVASTSIDTCDAEAGYPRRAAVFQGGDEIQLSLFRSKAEQWWLVYEHEFQPIGKKYFDLRELLRFGISRMNATAQDLDGAREFSWDTYFGVTRG